jgi:diguanylate cyclase (GGDEF)-like protein
MTDKSFIMLLHQSLKENPAKALPVEGLTGIELLIAEKINHEMRETATCRLIAGSSMSVIERAESFYEKIIGVISAMIRVSALSGNDRDIDTLCREMVEIFSKELEFDNCSIMLKDEKGKSLVLIAGSGKGDIYSSSDTWQTGTVIDIGEGVAGKAFSEGRAVFVSEIEKDPTFKTLTTCVSITSLLSVPIKACDEVIGVINFSHPLRHEIYDANMENIMMLLAGFTGQAITVSKLCSSMTHWNLALKDEVTRKTAELTKKNRQLRKIALIDPLTGIFNRRFFFKRLEEEFLRTTRYGVHFSLLFIDIDNLKPINDTYGHIAGDKVIRTLSNILRQIGRKGDVACRLGGDEFGYALLSSDMEGAHNFALRLQEKFAKHHFKGMNFAPTVSIGIANTKNASFKDHKDIYNAADKALYEAKLVKNAVRLYSHRKKYLRNQLPLID